MDTTPDSSPYAAPLTPPDPNQPNLRDSRRPSSNRVRNLVVAGAVAFGAATGGVIWVTTESGPAGDEVDLLTDPVVVVDDRATLDMSYPAEWDALPGDSDDGNLEGSQDALAPERRDTIDEPDHLDDSAGVPGADGDDLILPDPDHPENSDVILVEEPAGRVCLNTVHQPADGQQSRSRVDTNGEILGAPDGSIVIVEGPTFNMGQPIEIPIVDDAFTGQLGINEIGAHPFDRFEVVYPDARPPVDLIEATRGWGFTLDDPGAVVGPGEGPVFDDECVDLHSYRLPEPMADGEMRARVSQILSRFVDGHRNGDVPALAQTLSPAVPAHFGDAVCLDYLARTVGSVVDVDLVSIDARGAFVLDTVSGPVEFDDVVTATVDLTTTAGRQTQQINLPVNPDDSLSWLTHCQ